MTMRRAERSVGAIAALGAALALALAPQAAAAADDCDAQVADAFAKQRASSAFRMKTTMIDHRGVVHMTVDYQLPDRMHQTVKAVTEPAATETILVGTRAWVSTGAGQWQALPVEDAEDIAKQVREAVVEAPKAPPKYRCLGATQVEGRALTGFEAIPEKNAPSGGPVTNLYVDPTTGLPARTTVAAQSRRDRPFFKQDFSYPQDIKVEPPEQAK
ncbi:MAG: hypothetical protein AB7E80_15295 [Hyphomicrobiaceae bacterium]